jgi:hypothetical protein
MTLSQSRLRPSRRSIVKGAAWAVPVVVAATAAPAAAQSACTPSTVFNSLPVGQCVTNLTFAPSTVTGTLTYASWGQPSSKPGDTCRVAQVSGPNGWRYVELEMVSSLNKGDYVELTISLSQPVDDLSFVLHDIDKVRDSWDDTVQVMTPGYTDSGLHLRPRQQHPGHGDERPAVPGQGVGRHPDHLGPGHRPPDLGGSRQHRHHPLPRGHHRQLHQPAHRPGRHPLQRLRRATSRSPDHRACQQGPAVRRRLQRVGRQLRQLSDVYPTGSSQTDRSGPFGTMPVGLMSRCTW